MNSINGIYFTRREIDVISCIINTKKTKKIASILAISHRTVEVHIQKLMFKIKCNRQEAIIDFAERTKEYQQLQHNYFLLNLNNYFLEQLKKIKSTAHSEAILSLINYDNYNDLEGFLVRYLNTAGIQVITNPSNISDSKFYITFLITENLLNSYTVKNIINERNKNDKKIILLKTDKHIDITAFKTIDQINIIDYTNHKERYLAIFKILSLLLPTLPALALEKILSQFEIVYENLDQQLTNTYPKELQNYQNSSENKIGKKSFFIFNPKYLLLGCIFLVMFFTAVISYKNNYLQNYNAPTIISNFPILREDILLNRPNITNKIDKIFKDAGDIKTVALSGLGGVGKTTIARWYANNQKANIIWEINAETKITLLASIERLAYALGQKLEDKQQLAIIEEIENIKIREQEILLFVQKKLKTLSNWLLIYDNVESFKNIQEYFPYNSNSWGKGRIILTTRDGNIISNSYIKSDNVIRECSTNCVKLKK
ncbi:MAG: LuxR C-terminal-related transcriptional regulator [Rickettsia endosymbiont of Oxypoda opaca]|nr:LuxR C-terminal-related transcriptional regulator [Rickettsia endosymbiont of Oxypoda opaca]